jgi:hypothetical protein
MMAVLEIFIDGDRNTFEPGDTISGKVRWFLEKETDVLTLSLFWRTVGRGTEDMGLAESLDFENPGLSGESSFSMKCPEGPYSFSGTLISIVWGLELTGKKGKNAVVEGIVIGPGCAEVVCTDYIEELTGGESRLKKAMQKFKTSNRR